MIFEKELIMLSSLRPNLCFDCYTIEHWYRFAKQITLASDPALTEGVSFRTAQDARERASLDSAKFWNERAVRSMERSNAHDVLGVMVSS